MKDQLAATMSLVREDSLLLSYDLQEKNLQVVIQPTHILLVPI